MLRPVVTFWNAAPYIRRCLRSIREQRACHWHCHVFDDCSTDGGADLAAEEIGDDRRFTLVRNAGKMWQVGNWWQFARLPEVADEDVVLTIDGDDWLPDPGVFDRVLTAHADGVTWVTYGNFVRHTSRGLSKPGYCRQVERAGAIRSLPWVTSHLRTFKAFLLRRVREEHLRTGDGAFLPCAGDLAVMFPMIEMAGDGRNRCLPDVNYVYNVLNPNCDFRLRKDQQEELNRYLRSLPPYAVLQEPA